MKRESELSAWLTQFKPKDQFFAKELFDKIEFVSGEKLRDQIREEIFSICSPSESIALFPEREVKKTKGKIRLAAPFYEEKSHNHTLKRAYGNAPPVITPNISNNHIGSEGIIAQITTEISRSNHGNFFIVPSPNTIRKRKVRKFILITDFIGSGQRITDYLDAIWAVKSVKSWLSLKLISIRVVAFSATKEGIKVINKHPSKPILHIIRSCPTISNTFPVEKAKNIKIICIEYDPKDNHKIESLGYKGTGAIIAFEHGIPNNSPRILHYNLKGWVPIFPNRTVNIRRKLILEKKISDRLNSLQEKKISEQIEKHQLTSCASKTILLLAALKRPPRGIFSLSLKTGFSIIELEKQISIAKSNKWINSMHRLTDFGKKELSSLRRQSKNKIPIEFDGKKEYYPIQLRAPQDF